PAIAGKSEAGDLGQVVGENPASDRLARPAGVRMGDLSVEPCRPGRQLGAVDPTRGLLFPAATGRRERRAQERGDPKPVHPAAFFASFCCFPSRARASPISRSADSIRSPAAAWMAVRTSSRVLDLRSLTRK